MSSVPRFVRLHCLLNSAYQIDIPIIPLNLLLSKVPTICMSPNSQINFLLLLYFNWRIPSDVSSFWNISFLYFPDATLSLFWFLFLIQLPNLQILCFLFYTLSLVASSSTHFQGTDLSISTAKIYSHLNSNMFVHLLFEQLLSLSNKMLATSISASSISLNGTQSTQSSSQISRNYSWWLSSFIPP